jgi:pilus assembly protein CpaD
MTMPIPTQNLAVLVLAGFLAAACQSPFNGSDDALSANNMHPIAIDTALVSGEFVVPISTFTLSDEERDRTAGFIADYHARGLGKLSITSPTGTPNAAAAIQIAAEMSEIARTQGVRAKSIEIAPYRAPDSETAPPILLSFTAYQASASACGDFSQNMAFAPLNQLSPNHGCATQHNLAAMVEDPQDLVHPRGEGPPDQMRRENTLDKYRKGETTAAEKSDQGNGAVSEVKQ